MCCGESEYGFLTIDHVENDSYTERGNYGKDAVRFYSMILNRMYEGELQVLCLNCNLGGKRRNEGVCPHRDPEARFVCCFNQSLERQWCCEDRKTITISREVLSRRRLSWSVLSNYSGGGDPVCNCCGEGNLFFLTIDHINNDGRFYKEHTKSSRKFWNELMSSPIDLNRYQVLCYNCNVGRSWREDRVCPHKNRLVKTEDCPDGIGHSLVERSSL
jgi:hypothetical protein